MAKNITTPRKTPPGKIKQATVTPIVMANAPPLQEEVVLTEAEPARDERYFKVISVVNTTEIKVKESLSLEKVNILIKSGVRVTINPA